MKRTLIAFDWAIKGVLRQKANTGILDGFFSELLGRTVEVQELVESESNPDGPDDKTNRLDLKAKIDGGEIVIFELQVGRECDFFHRVLYGSSRAVVEQLNEGDEYGKIRKVYSVAIVYFELGRGSDYIYHGSTDFKGVHNHETLLLSENEMKYLSKPAEGEPDAGALFPEYYIIYPNRFDGQVKSAFDEWVSVFKTSEVDSGFTAAGIQKAGEVLDKQRMTPDERVRYEAYIKATRVKSNEISSAKWEGLTEGMKKGEAKGLKKGRAEGRAEGEKRKAAEIAKAMKAEGIDPTTIAKITKLSASEIARI